MNPLPVDDEGVEAYLLDSAGMDSGRPELGGSGRTFDWSLAARFPRRKIVAGGLDEWNVAAAIEASAPWGVDACSRLELQSGNERREARARLCQCRSSGLARETAQEVYL